MTGLLNWDRKPSDNYEPGWFVGSEGENGEHMRGTTGWPFSVYRKSNQIGGCDMVLCHGIQSFSDACEIATLCDCGKRIAEIYA